MKELSFDIFEGTPETEPRWIEAVEDLDNARARMEMIASEMPGTYFVYSLPTHTVISKTDTSDKCKKATAQSA